MRQRLEPEARPRIGTNPVPRWVAPGFALAAVATVPWVVFLGATLPASVKVNDRLAWVGFDIGLVTMLATTAYLAWRAKPNVALAATALATMLVVDAWFDVNTSPSGAERDVAIGLAVVEVSLAGVSLWIAFHAATVVQRRLDDLATRAAEREARRQDRPLDRPEWLVEIVVWARDLPRLSTNPVMVRRGRLNSPELSAEAIASDRPISTDSPSGASVPLIAGGQDVSFAASDGPPPSGCREARAPGSPAGT